jgi:hypothetical protein
MIAFGSDMQNKKKESGPEHYYSTNLGKVSNSDKFLFVLQMH